tara:strand:- start:599 stop:829 length:231 start_codon:yes stop_codon:yes gene_type:complete
MGEFVVDLVEHLVHGQVLAFAMKQSMREMEREVLKYDENANLAGHCPAIWKVSKAVLPRKLPREHGARKIAAETSH